MRLYNAGIFSSNFHLAGRVCSMLDEHELAKRKSVVWHLESYHYIGKGKHVRNIREEGKTIFLDSGAYSAFRLGATIDLNRYCDFILQNDDIVLRDEGIKMIAPLDVIGDAEASFKNMELMENQGTEPLPCFHFGEPWEYLDYYMSKYPYIALGGLVRTDMRALISWFDQVFERIGDEAGRPKVKLHAFGLTSLPLMMKYPWWSVDSSTWVQWSANGMVLMPYRGGQLNVSSKSSARKLAGQHLDSLPDIMTDVLEQEISQCQQDPRRLRDNYYSRWAFNAWAFPEYANIRPKPDRYVPEVIGLFA